MTEEKKEYYKKILFKTLVLVATLIGLFLAYKVVIFFVPFVIAFIISSMIEPIIQFFMNKCKMKRKLAASISLILVTGIIGSLLTLLVLAIVSEAKSLISNLNTDMSYWYQWGKDFTENISTGVLNLPADMANSLQDSLSGVFNIIKNWLYSVATGVVNFAGGVPTGITYTVITILAIIFMCFDKDYMRNLFKRQLPEKWINKFSDVKDTSWGITFNYIKAEAKLSFICFIVVTIGLTLFNIFGLHVKYLAIMSVFIGFVDLLPLFGAGSVMVPWAIILISQGNAPLGIAIIILWITWSIVKQIIEPKFVSTQLGMHPLFTLLGMFTGFKLFGVLGLMIGPILFLIIKQVFEKDINKGILKEFFELK